MINCATNYRAFIVVFTLLAIVGSNCCAQTPSLDQANGPLQETGFTTVGVKECAACHSHPSPIYERLQVTSFVRMVEAKEWLDSDKHAVAYDIVHPDKNELTRTICEKLSWQPGGPEFATNCLTCHAGVDHRQPIPDESTLQFGVQCEACHGSGSEWTKLEHHQQVEWRMKSPQEKLKLGMRDLVSPTNCAEVCYSCHIGDIDQNRFVTHAMYAAGHPPLPPVELQTFLDAMPPHWKTLAEKPLAPSELAEIPERFERQDEYYVAHFGEAASSPTAQSAIRDSYRRSQTSRIGSLVAQKFGLEQIRDAAERESLWGDYALYDCAACHHELIKPSTRVLPVGRTPGRPYPATWWYLNIEPQSDQATNLHQASSEIFEAFDKTPFGHRETVGATMNQVFAREKIWSEAWQISEQEMMTEKSALAWLRTIVHTRADSLSDFWTARQTGWMVKVVVDELVAKGSVAEQPVAVLLSELSKELQLKIAIPQKQLVTKNLNETLNRSQTFNSERCKQILHELLRLASQ